MANKKPRLITGGAWESTHDVFLVGTIEAIVVMDVYVYIKAGDIKWGYNIYIYILYNVNGDTLGI